MIVSELLTLNLDIITKKFTDLLKRFSGGFISGRKYETSTNEWPKSTILTSFSGTSWSLTGKSISAPLLDLKTSRKLAINKSWEIRVFATFELLTTCFHKKRIPDFPNFLNDYNEFFKSCFLKFIFSKKATKIDEIFSFDLTFTT